VNASAGAPFGETNLIDIAYHLVGGSMFADARSQQLELKGAMPRSVSSIANLPCSPRPPIFTEPTDRFIGMKLMKLKPLVAFSAAAFLLLSGGTVNAQAPTDAMIPDSEAKLEASERADDTDWGWLGLLGLLGLGGLSGRSDALFGRRYTQSHSNRM
jgi:hypothetical protein